MNANKTEAIEKLERAIQNAETALAEETDETSANRIREAIELMKSVLSTLEGTRNGS